MSRVQTATPAASSVSGTTLSCSFASNVPVGDHIIVGVGFSGGAGNSLQSVTDDAGNTYDIDHLQGTGTGTGAYSVVASCLVTTQLTAGASITMTLPSAQTHRLIGAVHHDDLDASDWFDRAVSATGTSTTPSSGAVTPGFDGIAVGVCCWDDGAQNRTAGAGWSEAFEVHSSTKGLSLQDRTDAAPEATTTDSGTFSTSELWTNLVAIYRTAGDIVGSEVADTDMSALTSEDDSFAPAGHRRAWWNAAAGRWDAILPMAVPPAAAASDWWIVSDITGTPTAEVLVDDRTNTRPDIVWDEANAKLYVLGAQNTEGRFYSYDYAAGSYTVDVDGTLPGISSQATEANSAMWVTPNGNVWVAGNEGDLIVNRSADGGATWGTPVTVKATAGNGKVALAHFENGGTTYLCVGANEDGLTVGAVTHFVYIDEDDAGWDTAGNWTDDTANLPAGYGANYRADDEMSLVADSSGNVYMCIETEPIATRAALTTAGDPQWLLWKRTAAGVWSEIVLAAWTNVVDDDLKRPGVAIDETNDQLYVFASQAGNGSAFYRRAPLASVEDLATAPNVEIFHEGGKLFYSLSAPRTFTSQSGLLVLIGETTGDTVYASHVAVAGSSGSSSWGRMLLGVG